MKITNLKIASSLEEEISLAIEKFNDFIDELELGYYLNSLKDLNKDSIFGIKNLYDFYDDSLYIGINKLDWIGGDTTYQEVFYDLNLKEIKISEKKLKGIKNENI